MVVSHSRTPGRTHARTPPAVQRRKAVTATTPNDENRSVQQTSVASAGARTKAPLTEQVLNSSPGRTPKLRNPPKAPKVERSDGLRHMGEADMAAEYTFHRQVGCGNWASVWIVETKRTEEIKAMKIVHRASQSGALQRFNALTNEWKVFQHLSEGHRNVVTFEEFLLTPSYACLVMPYYDEPMTVCLPFAACRVYFHGMATAVQWLHTNHVTHNDIKLANTLVKRSAKDPIGQPVLVDFGFARNHSRGTNFVSTESWGTPEYLSPERTVGDAHDERLSDLWALGVSFFEMATGRTPFEQKDEVFTTPEAREEYYRRTVAGTWYTDYDLPSQIEELCRGIVQLDPAKRTKVPAILSHEFFSGILDEPEWREAALSTAPSEQDLDVVCQRAGRRLSFRQRADSLRPSLLPVTPSLSPRPSNSPESPTTDVVDPVPSTVPFPGSPSLRLVEASFDSDLVQSEAPWSKRISSDAVRAHLAAVESPRPVTRSAAQSQSMLKGPTTSPRRKTLPKKTLAAGTPKHAAAIPQTRDCRTSSRIGTPSRPVAPTPSRFRDYAHGESNDLEIVLSDVSSSRGLSPIRYVGSLSKDAALPSLLPVPSRLTSSVRFTTLSEPAQPELRIKRPKQLGQPLTSESTSSHAAQQVARVLAAPPRYGSIVAGCRPLETSTHTGQIDLAGGSAADTTCIEHDSNVSGEQMTAVNASVDAGDAVRTHAPQTPRMEVSLMTDDVVGGQSASNHIVSNISALLRRLDSIKELVDEMSELSVQTRSELAELSQSMDHGQEQAILPQSQAQTAPTANPQEECYDNTTSFVSFDTTSPSSCKRKDSTSESTEGGEKRGRGLDGQPLTASVSPAPSRHVNAAVQLLRRATRNARNGQRQPRSSSGSASNTSVLTHIGNTGMRSSMASPTPTSTPLASTPTTRDKNHQRSRSSAAVLGFTLVESSHTLGASASRHIGEAPAKPPVTPTASIPLWKKLRAAGTNRSKDVPQRTR